MVLFSGAKIVIACTVALMAGLIYYFVPPNMDVFLPYHPIACWWYPFAKFHDFREACSQNLDLKIAGIIPWTRSKDYAGIANSLVYFPLFLIAPYWQSAASMGAVWLALIVFCFSRFTRTNIWLATLMIAGNFFVAYNILYDVSPVGLQVAALFAIPLLIQHIARTSSQRTALSLNLFLAVIIFLGFEAKAIFAYYLPAMLPVIVVLQWQRSRNLSGILILIRKCLPAIFLAAILCLLLIFAKMPDNQAYWHALTSHPDHYRDFWPYMLHSRDFFATYILNFPNSGGIVYGTQDFALLNSPVDYKGMMITAPFWQIILYLYIQYFRAKPAPAPGTPLSLNHKPLVLAFLFSAGLAFLLTATSTLSRHAMHLVPTVILILGGACLCMEELWQRKCINLTWVIALLTLSQIGITLYVVQQKPLPEYGWDRMKAIEFLRQPEIGDHAVISHLDWGSYYPSALFGSKQQLVTYNQPLRDEGQLQVIINIATELNRSLVFVRRQPQTDSDFNMILAKLPTLRRIFPREENSLEWEVWAEAPIADALDHKNQPPVQQ